MVIRSPGGDTPQPPGHGQLLKIRVLTGSAVVFLAALAAWALPVSYGALRLAVLCTALFLFAAVIGDPVAAIITGLTGYLFFHAFVAISTGELTGSGRAGIIRFISVGVAVALGIGLGRRYRRVARR